VTSVLEDNLLRKLSDLQAREGWLSEASLRAFSEREGVPLYRLQEVASFYPHYRLSPPPSRSVALCRDAACHLAGGPEFGERVRRALEGKEGVEVREVSCVGRCDAAPAACVDDVPILGGDAHAVVEVAAGRRPLPPDEPTSTPRRWPVDPYGAPDERYGVLRRLLRDREAARRAVPGVLESAGLRGMGGAGFKTGLKWRLVRDAEGSVKYAVVNADESEPSTFKDRVILEELPHLVIEGLLIGSVVAGASEAIVYVRHEYHRETVAIEREIERARALGVLREAGVEVSVFVSPGGYILGEETALLEALEGKRGEPRNKPPYPTTHGLFGRPTLMNNVETFAHVPLILTEGAERWRAHGVNGGVGWKFLSLCGHVRRPGVYCVPMGTTARRLVEDQGGGVPGGRAVKAYSPSGASAPFLPASMLDTPLDFDPVAKAGSMLGSGAVLVVAEGTDLLDLATNLVRFFRNESCGKCVPCRVGSEKSVEILDRLLEGEGGAEALATLGSLDEAMRLTSICGLGQVVLNPVTSVLRHFPEEVAARTAGR
jgi:NADH:ubiquinone oxidoreductase subunit F (NADH-binding)/NADH:ubiquinone oxidoreductase subunit E